MSDQEHEVEPGKTPPLPKPDLTALVQVLFMQGLVATGKIPSPLTNKYETDKNLAKYQVEMLEMLEEKTRGNRNEDEDKMLQDALHQIRMAYVDATRQN